MVDLRDVADDDYLIWEKVAKHIIENVEPGTVIALGCHDGDDRSVHISKLIQKYMPDVVTVDRDLSPEAGKKD